jgi:hypothetical protein
VRLRQETRCRANVLGNSTRRPVPDPRVSTEDHTPLSKCSSNENRPTMAQLCRTLPAAVRRKKFWEFSNPRLPSRRSLVRPVRPPAAVSIEGPIRISPVRHGASGPRLESVCSHPELSGCTRVVHPGASALDPTHPSGYMHVKHASTNSATTAHIKLVQTSSHTYLKLISGALDGLIGLQRPKRLKIRWGPGT